MAACNLTNNVVLPEVLQCKTVPFEVMFGDDEAIFLK